MSIAFKIELNLEPHDGTVTRFRNLGEAVWKELQNFTDLNLDEIDRSETCFYIRGVQRRDVPQVLPKLKKLISQHYPSGEITLTRLDEKEL